MYASLPISLYRHSIQKCAIGMSCLLSAVPVLNADDGSHTYNSFHAGSGGFGSPFGVGHPGYANFGVPPSLPYMSFGVPPSLNYSGFGFSDLGYGGNGYSNFNYPSLRPMYVTPPYNGTSGLKDRNRPANSFRPYTAQISCFYEAIAINNRETRP